MANDWQMVPIGEATIPAERLEKPIGGKSYRQIGVRLWGEGVYERESIDGGNTRYAFFARVEKDDIVVNKIWARNGSVAIVPEKLAGCYVSTEFPIFAPIQDRLFPRWFHWLTKTRDFWNQCDEKSRGTSGKNRIRPEQFLQIKIPLPPLSEQQRIVARVDALARRVEEARGLRRAAVEGASTLISSLHLTLSGSRVVKIGNIMTLDEDRQEIIFGELYPQVGVKGFGQGLFPREILDASQTTYNWFNRLYYGATVLSQVKGWEGAIAVCLSELAGKYVSPEYRTFRCISDQAVPEYLSELFSTRWFWIQLKDLGRGVGGRRERLRPERFIEMELPMPSVNDQKRAVEIFEKVKSLRPLQAATQEELNALMLSILAKAFAGEL